jgi:hypothetical protein
MLVKQALYHLNHTSSAFCSSYFGDRISRIIYLGWPRTSILPISASQVARIIGYNFRSTLLTPSWKYAIQKRAGGMAHPHECLLSKCEALSSKPQLLPKYLACFNQNDIKKDHGPECQWLTPIILATQEAEMRRIEARSQPGQIVLETLSWKNPSQKRTDGVAQGVGPEFKPQYCKKKKKKGPWGLIKGD